MAELEIQTDRLRTRLLRALLDDPNARPGLVRDLRSVLTPCVLAPLPPALHLGQTPIADWLAMRMAESEVHSIVLRETGKTVGLLILARSPGESAQPPALYIGYLLGEDVWGLGLATELLQGLITELGTQAPLRLMGGVGTDNPASTRVLEKVGFRRDTNLSTGETVIFALDLG